MNQLKPIINIGVVAHVDAGKTTITEQLLYQSGALRKMGSVDHGTSQTDFMEIERFRGISVKSSSVTLFHHDVQINLIDTPGHVDFVSEVERALSVLDTAVLVISAVDGIQSQTEILYEALKATHTNVIIFINKIDLAGSRTAAVMEQLRTKFSPACLLLSQVSRETEKDCEVSSRSFEDSAFYEEVCELLSDFDDSLMERYLSGESIPAEELGTLLKSKINDGTVLPVLCGSAMTGTGILPLLDFLANTSSKNSDSEVLSGVIYKITHDKMMGKLAHVRLFSGTIKNRDSIQVASSEEPVKVTQIRRYNGQKYTDIGIASKGDVVALCGLPNVKISDIIGEAQNFYQYQMAVPLIKVTVLPKLQEQLYPLLSALEEIADEDPQLNMEFFPDEREINISITGKIQLEILSALLKERYELEAEFSNPTVIYKETPASAGNGFDAYTMPKPCWAVISLDIEPAAPGSGLIYRSVVPNDKIFYRYQHHIETELPRALKQGLYNWEVTDLKVTLVDGAHHTVHTHPLDFFLATPLAVMNGLQNTGTTLLEPLQTVRIIAPEEYVGKIIGDIIAMRGRYDSPVIKDGAFTLEAVVPVSTSLEYAIRLASLTSGKGMMTTKFSGYAPCPVELGAVAKRHGVNPLDREKWILSHRNAMS